jgi:hypothetical protein
MLSLNSKHVQHVKIYLACHFKVNLITHLEVISTVTEKNATKNILDGRKDGQTDRGKTVYPPLPSGSGV